ncbi:MAG: site-specific integrase [Clostridia bacterium]|nr:site-specific integrase [Clostridia bacterium]
MNMKFEVLANDWLTFKKPIVKQTTYFNYKRVVTSRLLKNFKGFSARKLINYDFNQYVASLMNERLDNKTVKDTIVILKQMLKFAEIKYNLKINLNLINTPKLKEKEITVFDNKEYNKLKSKLLESNKCVHLGILISLLAGLRIGEICGLKWEDIDFEKRIIKIRHIVTRVQTENESTKAIMSEPKTKNSIRIIPLSNVLYQKLKEMSKEYKKEDFIITGESERYTEPILYERLYARFLKKIKIRYKKYHTLRHTFATYCIQYGMPIKELSLILGHADISTTLKFYVRPNLEASVKYLNQL